MDEPTQLSTLRPRLSEPEQPGTVIGDYTLLRALGEGGFGTVYEAEQAQPIRRRVALKLLKHGMASTELLARFELERQALARMDHPHIAKVLDGGSTADGRPYFVMELVLGESITRYCESHALDLRQRMELVVQVCDAVQHAHARGVIHRDLKPGNVLVSDQDGAPFARVIDFGIAKPIDAEADDDAPRTAINVLVGTPAYMSPEQAEGSPDIDTRTDVYALGVLLYELLTGSTPHDADTLRGASSYEIQRIIREIEPPAPSARLQRWRAAAREALRRSPPPGATPQHLRGELDWIVMKALEKDRERRYPTASELAADLRRHLAGQPVLAAPPSRIYRLRKLIARHRLAAAALLLLVLTLAGAVIGIGWQARIAAQRADELARILEFEQELFARIDPAEAGAALTADVLRRLDEALEEAEPDPALRAAKRAAFVEAWQQFDATDSARALIAATLLEPAIAEIDEGLADQPRLAADLRSVFAERYRTFGDLDAALAQAGLARALYLKLEGPEHATTLDLDATICSLLRNTGRRDEAEALAREALGRARKALGDEHEVTLSLLAELGSVIQDDQRLVEAEPYIREAYSTQRRLFGLGHYGTQVSLNDLAILLRSQSRSGEAEALFRELLAAMRETSGEDDVDVLSVYGNLAGTLREQGRLDEAEAIERDLLERRQRLLGREHPDTLYSLMSLAGVLAEGERYDEAEKLLRTAVRRQAKALPATHPEAIHALWELADVLLAQQRYDEAETSYRDAIARSSASAGPEHVDTLRIELDLAALLRERGDAAAAEALLGDREALFLLVSAGEHVYLRGHYHYQRALAAKAAQAERDVVEARLLAARQAFLDAGDGWAELVAEVDGELATLASEP